jgi:two-component system, NtrC family, response regulator PilR
MVCEKCSTPWPTKSIAGRQEVPESCRALLVSVDLDSCGQIGEILVRLGVESIACTSLSDARSLLEEQTFQFILCGDELPDCNLRTAVRVLSSSNGDAPVIVLSRLDDWDAYMKTLGAGAFDYIACPPDLIEADRILRLALDKNPPPRDAFQATA